MHGESFDVFTSRFVDVYDEPFGDTSGLSVYAASALARANVKAALSGDGGDELFGGYIRSRADVGSRTGLTFLSRLTAKALATLPTKRGERHLLTLLSSHDRILATPAWLHAGQKRMFIPFDLLKEHIYSDYDDFWFFRKHLLTTDDPIRNRLYMDFNTWLPEKMLTKVDRASMANSLEVRVPLLDYKLVEYVFSLPSHFAWHPRRGGKWILKEILRNRVPDSLLRRPKQGFSIPLSEWLDRKPELWKSRVRQSRFYREGILSRHLFSLADTRSPATKWILMNLAMWSDRYNWSV